MRSLDDSLMAFLDNPWYIVGVAAILVLIVLACVYASHTRLVIHSVSRNPMRTMLTGTATLLFVFIITLIWSVLWLLDLVTTERSKDFKAIVTEKWQIPSQMPFSYGSSLGEGAYAKPGDAKPQDYMTWQFFGGTLDEQKTRENLVFFFCMEPKKMLTMMDDFNDMSAEETALMKDAVEKMEKTRAASSSARIARGPSKKAKAIAYRSLASTIQVLTLTIARLSPSCRKVVSRSWVSSIATGSTTP
jgi:hypothetical protein